MAAQGKTVVFVLKGTALKGLIALSDIVRPTAKSTVEQLKSLHIQTVMMTGDNLATAAFVGKATGIDQVYAEMLPRQKQKLWINYTVKGAL